MYLYVPPHHVSTISKVLETLRYVDQSKYLKRCVVSLEPVYSDKTKILRRKQTRKTKTAEVRNKVPQLRSLPPQWDLMNQPPIREQANHQTKDHTAPSTSTRTTITVLSAIRQVDKLSDR